jgi:hypothetical protein
MADDKIIDKIQKLLALATSDNVNEAAAAAARAQELMSKHRLAMADIEAAAPGTVDDPITDQIVAGDRTHISWKVSLFAGIAQANGCSAYTQELRDKTGLKLVVTRFIGPASQLSTVTYLYEYLVKKIDELAAMNRKDHDRAWLRAFRLGAVAEITTRLLATVAQAKVGASSAALAVVDKGTERVQAAIAKLKLKSSAAPQIKDELAFMQGRAAGATIDLSTGKGLNAGSAGDLKG